jgi:hypothetical protein
MSIWKRRKIRERAIEADIAEAQRAREEIVSDRITVNRAVASFLERRPTDKFGDDLEDTFNRRKPRHA